MIVITTMNALPDYCYECPCNNCEHGCCEADKEKRSTFEYRPYWCPLKEVAVMPGREKVIENLEKAKMIIEKWIPMFEQYNTPAGIDCAIAMLKEQEERIRELEEKLRALKYGDQDTSKSAMMPAT